ncbi:MAG: methionyl-tRNA formyltransferase [Flavobacteriaceae bacterium]
MKIIFMGTPEFASGVLNDIIEANIEVVAAVTVADKPAGRGRKLKESAVKQTALNNNIPVLQPTNLKSEDFLERLRSYKADLFVVVAFRMLPKVVWAMPRLGTFNLHASLLPKYRGAAPINWAIINGETITGVSTFLIDEKIDTGAILYQNEIQILPEDNLEALHDKMMLEGGKLVVETIKALAKGTISPSKQPETDPSPAPKLNTENTRIDWNKNAFDINNLVRGLDPYPGAWTTLNELNVKIHKTKVPTEEIPIKGANGSISTTKKQLFVKCGSGTIEVLSLKIQGKKLMDTKSLLNGFSFEVEDTFI